ncbi:hypothetical protein ACIBCR_15045 [Micromonospora echinospora]|uniref:hypothetical protein n=1 Tax=Micromonospora echinospora TaxID=1877 RepID=UPI0037A243CC
MRSRLVTAAVAVAVLLSAGCSSEDPMPAPDPAPTSSGAVGDAMPGPSSSPATEGPAADGARWPDGVTARLVAVERVPNSWGVDVPPSMAIVRMTLDVVNGSDMLLPVVPQSKEATLLYGPNRQECEPVTGYAYKDPAERKRMALDIDGGTQIPAGGMAQFVESELVPVDQLGSLTVVVEVPSVDGIRDPFTLTGVETLLKTVK